MTDQTGLGVQPNLAKAKLAAGGYAFGTWLTFVRTPAVVRMIAAAGLDMVFIDMEHSAFDWQTVADLCEMTRASGLTPIVRPYDLNGPLINRVQDCGAMGLVFHDVTSRAQVDQLRRIIHYPPDGHRGVTAGAAPTDYRVGDGKALLRFVNEQTLLGIQVESREGVDGIDTILEGGGVDLVEVGRNDLSTALGVPLQPGHALVVEALDHVIAACNRHGVAVGVTAASPEDAADLMRRGVRSVGYGMDKNILGGAYRAMGDTLRRLAATPR